MNVYFLGESDHHWRLELLEVGLGMQHATASKLLKT